MIIIQMQNYQVGIQKLGAFILLNRLTNLAKFFSRFLGDQNCFRKINIPPDVGSTEKYQGTLGHKVNHNFDATIKPERTESARYFM